MSAPADVLRRAPGWHVALSVAAAARVEAALRRRSLAATAAMLGLDVAAAPSAGAPGGGSGAGGAGGAPAAPDAAGLPRWTVQPVRATAAVMRRWPLGQDGPRGSAMCLRSSLVTAWRLRSLGPVVRIGVALDPAGPDAVRAPGAAAAPTLSAHAWVEVDGRPLDATAHRYRVMTSLVPARRAARRAAERAASR